MERRGEVVMKREALLLYPVSVDVPLLDLPTRPVSFSLHDGRVNPSPPCARAMPSLQAASQRSCMLQAKSDRGAGRATSTGQWVVRSLTFVAQTWLLHRGLLPSPFWALLSGR